jgi:YVTN family beta-propeller protein
MSLRRVGWLAATALAMLLWLSCGDVYRPVVIPISTTPPNSANFHAVFAISSNAQANPGTALQIDVSGDTNIGQANMGINPTHVATVPSSSRVFVASAGSFFAGQSDVVTAFSPAFASTIATGLGNPTTFTFPNVGPIGNGGVPEWFCSYLPDFLTTTQTNVMYVANYGVENDPGCAAHLTSTDSVATLSTSSNTITQIGYLPAGSHPVALAETPNAQNLYVANQGNNTVVDLAPVDLSTIATIPVGATPVWAVARVDSRRVYVLSQGSGTLVAIDTATNTVLPSQTNLSVGVGANFLLYDSHLNRLYVTNPSAGTVSIFSATGGVDLGGNANDTPTLLATISMTAGSSPPCTSACSPVSVAALPDGSRFYVASYQSEASCSDANVGTAPCIIPLLTVFDALSMTVKPATTSLRAPSISLLTTPHFAATQYAVPPVASCAPAPTYSPGTTRFRMYTTAASDSSHVYVSICDAGAIADVVTKTNTISTGTNSPDTLVTDLPAPFGACSSGSCSSVASLTSFTVASTVVTFTAANSFSPGTRVAISGFTTSDGARMNGMTLTVLATGLGPNQFEAILPTLNPPLADGTTSDAGTAVPLAPPQAPIFLLTGQ